MDMRCVWFSNTKYTLREGSIGSVVDLGDMILLIAFVHYLNLLFWPENFPINYYASVLKKSKRFSGNQFSIEFLAHSLLFPP